jgi:hypothetical protein
MVEIKIPISVLAGDTGSAEHPLTLQHCSILEGGRSRVKLMRAATTVKGTAHLQSAGMGTAERAAHRRRASSVAVTGEEDSILHLGNEKPVRLDIDTLPQMAARERRSRARRPIATALLMRTLGPIVNSQTQLATRSGNVE